MGDRRSLVPTPLEDPGFKSLHRGIRAAVVIAASLVFLVGIWAWLLARPAEPGGASPLQSVRSAAPAVAVDSPDTALAARTPFPLVARASQVLARTIPLTALTPAPVRAVAAVPVAPASSRDVASVPRVMTPAEVASSSRMTFQGPPPAAPSSTSFTSNSSGGSHSSFFAQQNNGDVGYEPEDAACIVRATSAIQARLVTHVDSELPGGVVKAQVVTPVDCADGDEAVPAGATLQGTYDSATVAGESRLLVVFTRIIFPPSAGHPNGRAYAMATQSATDNLGGTGLSGTVNTHAGRLFGQALLYTILGAAGEAAGRSTSAGSIIVGSGTSVTGQFAPGAQTVKPTIYANPGDPVGVVLARDLPMEPVR